MIWLAIYTVMLPLPSWPCRLTGLPFPVAAFLKSVLNFLLRILFPIVVSSMSHYLFGVPLIFVVFLLPHCLPRVPLSVPPLHCQMN